MEVKSYFATTVEAAVELASREMGPEAMLITSRRTPAETAHLGRYEVVFARDTEQEPPLAPAPKAKAPGLHPRRLETLPMQPMQPAAAVPLRAMATSATARAATPARVTPATPVRAVPIVNSARSQAVSRTPIAPQETARLDELRLDLNRLRGDIGGRVAPAPTSLAAPVPTPMRQDFASVLDTQGISRADSREFFDNFTERRRAQPEPRHSVSDRIARLAGDLNCDPGMARTVALIGPPGVGKTTTLIKLAIIHGLAAGIPVRLFSMDCVRIAAADQLRVFAELLGASFQSFETFADLSHRLFNSRHDGLTLIDTAGYSRSNSEDIQDLGAALQHHPDVECQLVLRADRKVSDNLNAIHRFEPCRPTRLIVTGIDETDDLSDLSGFLAAQPLPVSFLGVGQRIPEDLEPAAPQRLAELIIRGWEGESRGAV